jgi:hypothetical protein
MRLTHLAFALTFVLVAITGYLAFDAQQEARDVRAEVDMLKRQTQAQIAAGAVPAGQIRSMPPPAGQLSASIPAPAFNPPITSQNVPPLNRPSVISPNAPVVTAPASQPGTPGVTPSLGGAQTPAAPSAAPMTPLQAQVQGMPALGKVTNYNSEGGFVIINAGGRQGIAQGAKFDLRRASSVVGRITISTVEDAEAVGDLDPRSVPAGVTVEIGDDVIQLVNPL